MGFLVSQHGQLCAIPRPPFLSLSPWRAFEVEVTLARYHMKTRQNRCDTPLCDTISTGCCALVGVSRTGPRSTPHFWTSPEILGKLRVIFPISFDLQSLLPLCAKLRDELGMRIAKKHDPFQAGHFLFSCVFGGLIG